MVIQVCRRRAICAEFRDLNSRPVVSAEVVELTRRHMGVDVAVVAELSTEGQAYRAVAGNAASFNTALDASVARAGTYRERLISWRASDGGLGGSRGRLGIRWEPAIHSQPPGNPRAPRRRFISRRDLAINGDKSRCRSCGRKVGHWEHVGSRDGRSGRRANLGSIPPVGASDDEMPAPEGFSLVPFGGGTFFWRAPAHADMGRPALEKRAAPADRTGPGGRSRREHDPLYGPEPAPSRAL
jgi:hypothetical protein